MSGIGNAYITLLIVVAIIGAIVGWYIIESILWLFHHISIVVK